MATVNISFFKAPGEVGGDMPIPLLNGGSGEAVTSSGTSSATTGTAPTPDVGQHAVARITPVGGNIHAVAAASPTATTSHTKLYDGITYDFLVNAGDKIAVIDGT